MSLGTLQHDFRSWLTVESTDAAARFGQHTEAGLSVYLNNYRTQLMACLAESFAVVRTWLGDVLYPGDPEVGDLARLERNLGLAFVGRDAEPLDLAVICSAIHAEATPPAATVLNEPVTLATWRNQFAPAFRTLETLEAHAISMVTQGRACAEICAAIVDEVGEAEGACAAGNLLGRWLNDGMIARCT